MSDTKWTAGPWRVVGEGYWVNGDYEDGGIQVATVGGLRSDKSMEHCHERWNADAHLIAAAPEIYEALEKMVEWHCVRGNTDEDPILDYEQQPHEVRQAMDALAKARGES